LYIDITNKQEFLSNIQGLDEIGINEREFGTLCCYNVAFPETFLNFYARECRGIIFNKEGTVIRRPFHKFFNLNEREETQLEEFDGWKITSVTKKMDGMMIAPFLINDGKDIFWGSKRASKDIHEYLDKHPIITTKMKEYIRYLLNNNHTPIFEFHDPDYEPSRIVVKYDKPFFKLITIRNMLTGKYWPPSTLEFKNVTFDIVHHSHKFVSLEQIVNHVQNLEGEEGFVVHVQNKDGDVVFLKIKSPWYVRRHKVKSLFEFDYIKAQLILECHNEINMDDISPYMEESDRIEFEQFSTELHKEMNLASEYVKSTRNKYASRKEFGLSDESHNNVLSSVVFRCIDTDTNPFPMIAEMYKKQATKETKFKQFRDNIKVLTI